MSDNNNDYKASQETEDQSRRDFLTTAATVLGGCAVVAVGVPLVSSWSPDAGVKSVSSTEVNIGNIKEGETNTAVWRGKPVFVRHRTKDEIESARGVDITSLRDPQKDDERVQKGKEQWLIVVGVCTHLGCVPVSGKGDYNGWFCPCHGSHYDTSGRIRKGPAPLNLAVPPYTFLNDNTIKIGD